MNKHAAQALICVLFVLALRAPFLNQPIQGDDVYYLAGAQYAQTDPLHPHHARYAFQGVVVDMRGHPHPPLNTWTLAGLLALQGDITERTYHAAYIGFSLIAALAMLSLARRFSSHPLAATLLFLATPAFVVNGTSLEADIPFLAFWMAAIALFVRAVESQSMRWLAGSVCAMVLAALAAFQSIALALVLAAYLLLRRSRWAPAWVSLAVPAVVLGCWQLWEKLAGGQLPAAVLSGYFQTYGLQRLIAKLHNAGALTVHTAWLVFPLIAILAFSRVPGWMLRASVSAAIAFALIDLNPLFWASAAIGALTIAACVYTVVKAADTDERFLAAWVVLFFAFALVVFFAGSARYLLPVAAPIALLVSRRLSGRTVPRASAIVATLAVGLALAVTNYQHWNGYRRFVESVRPEMASRRTWVNGEWGFRYYAETDGALPLLRGTTLAPNDLVLTSALGGIAAPDAPRKLLSAGTITSSLPLRLIGLDSLSGYSTAVAGMRPFDISRQPIDRVRAEFIIDRKLTLSYLPMNAPDFEVHAVSGLSNLESGVWRWAARRSVVMLKAPDHPAPLEASIYIPDNAKARRIQLVADGNVVADQTFGGPGEYTIRSRGPVSASTDVSVELVLDATFQAPGDSRELGVVLKGIGFR